MFRDKKHEIEFLLQRIGICFFEPEQQIMSQYDENFRQLIITGAGLCQVFKYIDWRKRIYLGNLKEGSLVGEIQVMFDSDPVYSIECMSYCTIGIISKEKFWELITNFPEMKQTVIDFIIQNPHDSDRENFVRLCLGNIDYLSTADEDSLRQLYYRSK